MKPFITKYSIPYWIAILVLLVVAFVGTEGFSPLQITLIAIALIMAVIYFVNKIQG